MLCAALWGMTMHKLLDIATVVAIGLMLAVFLFLGI